MLNAQVLMISRNPVCVTTRCYFKKIIYVGDLKDIIIFFKLLHSEIKNFNFFLIHSLPSSKMFEKTISEVSSFWIDILRFK